MILELGIAIAICILSYFIGCFSTARLLARSFRHLNVYKVGTGLADIPNIFSNISKTLGISAGVIDTGKMFIYISLIKIITSLFSLEIIGSNEIIFIFGFFMLAGHCLPLTHNFKGGRGIFTYTGLILVFIPWIMLGILVVALLLLLIFKQFRFAQYIIVLGPPVFCFFLPNSIIADDLVLLMTITAILMGILNFLVSKRLGEI